MQCLLNASWSPFGVTFCKQGCSFSLNIYYMKTLLAEAGNAGRNKLSHPAVVVVVVVSLFSSNVHSRITKYKNTNYMSHVTHKCLRDQWWNIAGGSQGSRSSSSWQPLMQLPLPAWDTCLWRQSPHMWCYGAMDVSTKCIRYQCTRFCIIKVKL